MADGTTPPATGTDPNKPDPPGDKPLGENGEKALREERRLRAEAERKLADIERRLQEIDDKDKSEIQKANDRAAAAEKRAEEAEQRSLRLEVATSKGLTAAQAKRLAGSTREELEADADELLETFKPAGDRGGDNAGQGGGSKPPSKPTENLRGGGDPTNEPAPDIRKIVDEIPRGV